jgi:hypothetical protein
MSKSTSGARTFLGFALVACFVSACGRKATAEDCQLIVDRLIEVEMHSMKTTDEGVIEKKQEAIRGTMKDELKDCVGRRVSDSMLACVKKATATEEILSCIR